MSTALVVLYFIFLAVFIGGSYLVWDKGIFNTLFSVVFGCTFFLGPPITFVIYVVFEIESYSVEMYFLSLLSGLLFYLTYLVFMLILPNARRVTVWVTLSKFELRFFGFFLVLMGSISLATFILLNGYLFFSLKDYDELFADDISLSWIRKFFYFFYPGILISYLSSSRKKIALYWMLLLGLVFGVLVFLAVGGSRASILLSFIFFFIYAIKDGHIKPSSLLVISPLLVVFMSFLAFLRYDFMPSDGFLLLNILSLTKGTFSPWENVAAIFDGMNKVQYQYFWPIIRDFYQYIPKALWLENTERIMNAGNYFTFNVLEKDDGLTFSPTVVGSLLIMGGWFGVFLGAVSCALWSWIFYALNFNASLRRLAAGKGSNRFAVVVEAYCVSVLFFTISLIRDGFDTFLSRLLFFSFWFVFLLLLVSLINMVIPSLGRVIK